MHCHCLETFMQNSYQQELRAPLGIIGFPTPLNQYSYRLCSSTTVDVGCVKVSELEAKFVL